MLTGVVSVADDGGSSGRLRELLNVVALGDLRKCLVALADEDSALADAFEHRYDEGELAGPRPGQPDPGRADRRHGRPRLGVAEAAAELLGARGDVLPATVRARRAQGRGRPAARWRARWRSRGPADIQRVSLVPGDAQPPPLAVERIAEADQIVIGPGSLFTSVLAAVAVGGIAEAVARSEGQVVYVCNLHPQHPRDRGIRRRGPCRGPGQAQCHGGRVLCDSIRGMGIGTTDVTVHDVPLTGENTLVHSPAKLAQALSGLLA